MHIKRSIGFVQLFFGIFLILSALFIMPLIAQLYARISLYAPAAAQPNIATLQVLGLSAIEFIAMVVLFGIMFALQGIVNTRIGNKYDLPLPKFGFILAIGFIVIIVIIWILRSIVSKTVMLA
jgi:hypothetical protein